MTWKNAENVRLADLVKLLYATERNLKGKIHGRPKHTIRFTARCRMCFEERTRLPFGLYLNDLCYGLQVKPMPGCHYIANRKAMATSLSIQLFMGQRADWVDRSKTHEAVGLTGLIRKVLRGKADPLLEWTDQGDGAPRPLMIKESRDCWKTWRRRSYSRWCGRVLPKDSGPTACEIIPKLVKKTVPRSRPYGSFRQPSSGWRRNLRTRLAF